MEPPTTSTEAAKRVNHGPTALPKARKANSKTKAAAASPALARAATSRASQVSPLNAAYRFVMARLDTTSSRGTPPTLMR
jgi:hypothetical protein